ncbi:MAG: hypothetical protein OEU36_06580 [Gammaproteobacteria bacterium]|nr:hypothetical protein [Gammaproteobacteria bacterium]
MSGDFHSIPVIDISGVYASNSKPRASFDTEIFEACCDVGFFLVVGQPEAARLTQQRLKTFATFFDLPERDKLALGRRQNNPESTNIYRGYFPPLPEERSFKEGIDFGPELPSDSPRFKSGEMLLEPNVWPPEERLPGWRRGILDYLESMRALGQDIMQSIARSLNLTDDWFERSFDAGNNTLRLLKYPPPPKAPPQLLRVDVDQASCYAVAYPHSDSGCLTLLAQDDVGGLQVENGQGNWIDVPVIDGSHVVNIGDVLARWTNDLFTATRHRVLSSGRIRYSMPFFFDPNMDALIKCIPGCEGEQGPQYPVFRYGDLLLEKLSGYTEFHTLFEDGTLSVPSIKC